MKNETSEINARKIHGKMQAGQAIFNLAHDVGENHVQPDETSFKRTHMQKVKKENIPPHCTRSL